jgi:hypothetical protein
MICQFDRRLQVPQTDLASDRLGVQSVARSL